MVKIQILCCGVGWGSWNKSCKIVRMEEEPIVIEVVDVLDLTTSHLSDKDLQDVPMPSTLTVRTLLRTYNWHPCTWQITAIETWHVSYQKDKGCLNHMYTRIHYYVNWQLPLTSMNSLVVCYPMLQLLLQSSCRALLARDVDYCVEHDSMKETMITLNK